jgi:putative ABC transport system permease protein
MIAEVLIILRRCALRHWRLAFKQQLMLVLILALGTGVYLAMRLANRAALAGFERFTDGVTRQADWTVQSAAGQLPMKALREMRAALGSRPVHLIPLVESALSPAVVEDTRSIGSRPTWRLVGMDFIGLLNLRNDAPAGIDPRSAKRHGVLVTEGFAKREHVGVGDALRVIIHERVESLTVAGLIPKMPDLPAPPDHLLLMDLADAQKLLGKEDAVDRVEVLAQRGDAFPGLREEAGAILKQAGAGRWLVLDREDKRVMAGTMTEAFRLNLTILSLLALFVGGYLIFQALDGVVLRRREEIGILKSLGITDVTIQIAFLAEALLLGLVGGGLGVLLGWAGSQGAVVAVTRTMSALYGATNAQHAALRADEAVTSLVIAIATSLVAAWWPARVAAQTPPAQMMGHHMAPYAGQRYARTERLGASLMIIATLLAQCPVWRWSSGARWPIGGYAAAILWLLGAGLAAGAMLRFVAGWLAPLGHRSAGIRIALSHLRLPSVRHRFAVAALASAVAMTAGMAVMVASFDHTMRDWIGRSMRADIYISSAGAQSASAMHGISASTVEELRATPEVIELACLQATQITLNGGSTGVMGSEPEFTTKHQLHAWVAPPPDHWWTSTENAIVNESFTERFNVHQGDTVELPTPHGIQHLRIAGVYADYGNERGSIMVPRDRFTAWFDSDLAWRVAMMLTPGTNPETVRARLQEAHPGLSIFTQSHLRSEALRIFRQTFSVTYSLEVIGVVVAVAGLGLALASLLLERREELHTLRSLGMTQREIVMASAMEGLGIAATGTGMGLAAGLWLGWLLIYRINKQCFGWTLSFSLPWGQLLALGVAVVGVGVIVASVVARRIKA